MFEVIVTVCLSLNAGTCRDQLVPGYEARDLAACEAMLAERPPDIQAGQAPRCVPQGPVLDVSEVAPGVYVHEGQIAEPNAQNRGDVSNLGFVIGERAVAVIDAGAARWVSEGLWRSIRRVTDLPVRYLILTHMHPDHTLGAAVFEEAGADILGHVRLPRALGDRYDNYLVSFQRALGARAMIGTREIDVTMPFEEGIDIDLGGRLLEVRAWPEAHSGSDVTALDRATGTLFAGDLVFHRHIPALDGKLRGWQAVLNTLAETPVSRIVPGHGGPVLPWPAGLQEQQRYLDTLAQDTAQALADGLRLNEAAHSVAASEAGQWALFEVYNPRNATVAYTELEWE